MRRAQKSRLLMRRPRQPETMPTMKITAVHSFYSSDSSSGENLAVEAQTQALADRGHEVNVVGRWTDDLEGASGYRLRSSLRVATGSDLGGRSLPAATGPEHVLLVHNLFPNFGATWLRSWPGPVVTMLHNFRYLCANGLLLRKGHQCQLCVGRSTWPALRFACYRDSRLATVPLAIANRRGSQHVTPLSRADVVVAQSERAHSIYASAGTERLSLVPGFGPGTSVPNDSAARSGWAFVGRLTPEKGLLPLMRTWPAGIRLDVIGDGPDRLGAEREAGNDVRFVGAIPHSEIVDRLSRYRGLVFPGICAEGAHPMVVREALAAGTPIVAAEGSSAADVVEIYGGGATYVSTDRASLRSALDVVTHDPWISGKAREVAASVFGVSRWQDDMDRVLALALDRHRRRARAPH